MSQSNSKCLNALGSSIATIETLLQVIVKEVNPAAEMLELKVGLTGREALELLQSESFINKESSTKFGYGLDMVYPATKSSDSFLAAVALAASARACSNSFLSDRDIRALPSG